MPYAPINVHLYRCNECHAVQAVEVRTNEDEMCLQTCLCDNRFEFTRIKVVD